jgi:hypothetical protein
MVLRARPAIRSRIRQPSLACRTTFLTRVRRLQGSEKPSGGRSDPLEEYGNEHHHNAQPADPIMDRRC